VVAGAGTVAKMRRDSETSVPGILALLLSPLLVGAYLVLVYRTWRPGT
jgi:hypothetical protein